MDPSVVLVLSNFSQLLCPTVHSELISLSRVTLDLMTTNVQHNYFDTQKKIQHTSDSANSPVVGWSSCEHSVTSSASLLTDNELSPVCICTIYN